MSEILSALPPILVCLLVCGAKIIEITIQSLKTCMMVKGQRLSAALLGFVECMIWGLVVSTVISTLGDNLLLLLFYCIGYAAGLFIGSTLEGKIALGTSSLELIASGVHAKLITDWLKAQGRGYTVFDGHGSVEDMKMIFIVLPRRDAASVLKELRRLTDGKIFVVASEVSKYAGGYGMIK